MKAFFAKTYVYWAVFTVDLLATTGDSWFTWTSPMYTKLYSNDTLINPLGEPITPEQDTWIGSLLNIGAMIGPLPFGYISEQYGRRIALLSVAIPHFIAYVTLAFAKHIYLYYFARILAGLAVGAGYALMPMYIAEISEDYNRGKMCLTLNIFWTLGNFLPYAMGPFLSAKWFNLILACLPVCFFSTFFIIAPESPYYLVSKNKLDQAKESLKILRNKSEENIEKELQAMKLSKANEEKGTFNDILKSKALRKALFISVYLVISVQLSGIIAILFYAENIFKLTGSKIPADKSSIIFGFVLFISSFINPWSIGRAGRRILLIASCIGLALCLGVLGGFFYLLNKTTFDTTTINWIPLVCLPSYLIFFNFGLSPVSFAMSSELFPTNLRSISSSVVASICWTTAFVVTKCFNIMNASFGIEISFWIFGGFCLLAVFFCILFVPETKGKSFNEIQEILGK